MARIEKGIKVRADERTGEIFYDVEVIHRGKVVASSQNFTEIKDAETFYFNFIDRLNIKRKALTDGRVKYLAEFSAPGIKRRSKQFDLFADAVKWRKEMRLSKESHTIEDVESVGSGKSERISSETTFSKFSFYWLKNEVKVMRALNTLKTYKRNLVTHVFPVIGKMKLCEIDKKTINELQAHLLTKELSPGSIHLVLAMTSRCLEYACEIDIMDKNVMRKFKKVPKKPKSPDYWEEGDLQSFIRSNRNEEYFSIFYTTLRAGLRKGEALGLKWDCVNFKTRQITISRIRTQDELKETTKSNKIRRIPMAADLIELLLELKERKKPKESDYVFTNNKGEEIGYQSINQIFDTYQKKAGVTKRLRFHDQRHTFASHCAMKGMNAKQLQTLLGHADAKMTEHYTHLNDEFIMQSVEYIEKLKL